MATKRVQIDEDLLKHPLTIDKAERVMALRRECAALERKFAAMRESYLKRIEPHNNRIAAIRDEIDTILAPDE